MLSTEQATEIEIVTEVEIVTEQTKPRRFGRTKEVTEFEFKPRKTTKTQQPKREFKNYKDYVCVDQQDIDTTTLVPLLQEDYDYNEKIKSKIEVGKKYSYKELCELLEEPYRDGGTAKQSQLATWYQHMEWEYPINKKTKKAGTKMSITTIFDTPRQKINQTYELSNFKKQELECNFISSIINNKNLHEVVGDFGLITGIRARDMHLNIGLVNNDYYSARSNKEAIADYLPIPNQIEMYSTVEKYNRQFTTGALNRLVRARVLESYAYTYIWTDSQRKEHLATDEEHLAIENGIKEMLNHAQDCGFEVKSIADIYNGKLKDHQAEDLHNHMMGLIKKEIPTIEYFSRAYKLVYLKSKLRDYLVKLANEMGITLQELQQTKLHDSRKEHTDFQVGKAMRRNNDQPKTQENEVSLINAIINNTNLNPLTDQERKLEHDRKFILDRVTVSDYITQLTLEDINKVLSDTVENHEQEYLESLLEDAISYCHMPLILCGKSRKEIEFADLNNIIDKKKKAKSFFIQCTDAFGTKVYANLYINHHEGEGKADKIEIALLNMNDIRNLQAYLIVNYNIEVKLGQRYKPKTKK